MKYLIIAICLCTWGCSFFEKREPSNEIVALTGDVLKADKGVEIEIKPIDVPYRK